MFLFPSLITIDIMGAVQTHNCYTEIMNVMFSTTAALSASIVACRAFVSLTNFSQKDVYARPPAPYQGGGREGVRQAGGRVCGSGGSDSDSDGALPQQKRRMRNVIAGIIFRNMAAGIDSMGETYSTNELGAARTVGTLVLDLKPDCDYGGANANGGVVVHTETTGA